MRNTSDIAILTCKFNSAAKKAASLDINREMVEFYLRSCGFTGNFEIIIPLMIKYELINCKSQGDYALNQDININQMNDVILDYRKRNRGYAITYRQRKLNDKCKEYREFLEKNGYFVAGPDDEIVGNTINLV